MIKEDSTWYLFDTSFGLVGKTSNDGLAWTNMPSPLLPEKLSWWETEVPGQYEQLETGIPDIWGPDLFTFEGRSWMYYAISEFGTTNSAIGLLSADSFELLAAGNWQDEGPVLTSDQDSAFNAIDPNFIVDAEDVAWMTFGSGEDGIFIVQLDTSVPESDTFLKPTGGQFNLAVNDDGIEGATIVYRNGFYYLFGAVGICCDGVESTYRIVYGRSTAITGPYVDQQGTDMTVGGGTILEDGDSRWVGPGGQDIAKIDGVDVIVFHTYDADSDGDPTLQIATLLWDTDNWPYLGEPQ